MRRSRFAWAFTVVAILLAVYGLYFVIHRDKVDNGVFVTAIIALSLGGLMLLVAIGMKIMSAPKKNKPEEPEPSFPEEEEPPLRQQRHWEEPAREEPRREEPIQDSRPPVRDYDYEEPSEELPRVRPAPEPRAMSCYVSKSGYGPVFEVSGNRFRDMRNNRCYRLDGSDVYSDFGGLVYEISGNTIRTYTGDPLYQISGDSINRVFGGHYASISGNVITKYDLSERYECSFHLSLTQILVLAALLFGK